MTGLDAASRAASRPGSQDRKSTRLNSSHVEISYAVFCLLRRPPTPTLFPYTTLFRSPGALPLQAVDPREVPRPADGAAQRRHDAEGAPEQRRGLHRRLGDPDDRPGRRLAGSVQAGVPRSEEHTSELQSRRDLVCRLLLAPPTTDSYTLSLHDALPISRRTAAPGRRPARGPTPGRRCGSASSRR